MRENFKEIPLLQQREIEIKAIGPLLRAFCREFGEERVRDVARRALQEISRELGAKSSAGFGGGLESLKKNCVEKWNEGGALKSTVKEDGEECFAFDVSECAFAKLYSELGYGDIGAIVSCDRDASFLEGFDSSLKLERTETLMEGGKRCDFCYRVKKEDEK